MNEHAKITFFKVVDCGYYNRGDAAAAFGSVQELLEELRAWCVGRPLAATKVFEVADGQDLHPAYVLDIKSDGDDWLLTTWNQTPASEAGVASVKQESSVGSAEVVMNSIEAGSIPGFATYFWFIPSIKRFASIRFQHLWTGQKSLQCYLESYLSSFSRHVVTTEVEDDKIEVLGYVKSDGDEPEFYHPRFRTGLVTKPGEKDLLRSRVDDIRRVIRKTTLSLNRQPDLDQWQKILLWTKIRDQPPALQKVKVQYEFGSSVSAADLEHIIAEWDAQHDLQWDDYGFQLKGESNKTYWLSRSLARNEFDLDVLRDNDEVVNSESLLRALKGKRAEILALLD